MNKKRSKIILIVFITGLLFSLPIVPIQVAPKISMRAIDANGNPVAGVAVYQDWKHLSFESESHRDESIADENGFAEFSEKKIWISVFSFLINTIGENTVGLIAVHSDSGPSVGFGATGYKTSNRWCYPENICGSRESAKEIIVLEKYER